MRNGVPFRISTKLHSKLKRMTENFEIKTGKQISMVKMSEMIADRINEDPFDNMVDSRPIEFKKKRGWPF